MKIIIILVLAVLLIAGCTQQSTQFTCPDGSVVSDSKNCPPLEEQQTKEPETTTIVEEKNPQIPECIDQLFTVSPIEINKISSLTPLGSINPPGHTFPTEHMYFHITHGGETTDITPLRAPGDIYITSISSSRDGIAGDMSGEERTEYTMHFSLCEDVYGYYGHVKELSDEILSIFEDAECLSWSVSQDGYCTKELFYRVSAGTVIGGVGHLQGNFDFGAYDYRTESGFANVPRYTSRTPYIVCPLEYYDEVTKEQLYNKIERTEKPLCGEVMQDVPGTLQGNWFHEDTILDVDWETNLAFVHDNIDPSKAIISVAGKFMEASKWEFIERGSGLINRRFSDVVPDNIYCYDEGHPGRIVVQLVNETELKIEYQDGTCAELFLFNNPTTYYR